MYNNKMHSEHEVLSTDGISFSCKCGSVELLVGDVLPKIRGFRMEFDNGESDPDQRMEKISAWDNRGTNRQLRVGVRTVRGEGMRG